MRRLITALVLCLTISPAFAWVHGSFQSSPTSFNGGQFQVNLNFPGIGGDYPFVNFIKNTSGSWTLRDSTGTPSPTELDQYGYPLPGAAMFSSGTPGVSLVSRIPAQAYVGNNCPNGASGICFSALFNGKGTYANPGTIITSGATGTVSTGAITTITFSTPQDFRAGMEVPISGTNGTVSPSLITGGATGAYTVCADGLSTTTIQLCLNDQVTPLSTTGTFTGNATVSYGRNAIGVASRGRVVSIVTGSPVSVTHGISAQDAVTPITYRNGIDGMAVVLTGSEEIRYEQWRAGTCPGGYNPRCQFGAAFLAKLGPPNPPGVIRHLNTINTNDSMEVYWADRRSDGYVSYGADIYDRISSGRSSSYAGTTTSVGNDYSVTLGSGPPVDGQQLILSFDATPVTVANGANALITWNAHGLSTASPFYLGRTFAGTMPTGTTVNATYYAITSCVGCDANNIQFATSAANAIAGTAVTTSSTGSGVIAHTTVVPGSATFTNASSSILWNAHGLSVGDQVSFAGTDTLGYPFSSYDAYYVVSVPDADHITVSLTSGGAALVSQQNGSFPATKNPTLNLNGTGAISIKDRQLFGVGLARTTAPWARNTVGQVLYASFTYDAVLGIWIKRGGDSSLGTQYFTSGWPPETALELCLSLGAHCWFTTPPFTFDTASGITDYNPSLYAMVKANSPAWHIPVFEGTPNEFWNNLFTGTNIGKGHQVVYTATAGWPQNTGTYEIAGKVNSVMGQAAWNEYGGTLDGSRYEMAACVQTFTFSGSTGPVVNNPRLSAAAYVAQSTPAQSPYTKSPASDWMTHTCAANYFTPGYYGNFVATSLAAANSGGVITGSISGDQLTVSQVRVATSPAFGVGSVLTQGPGLIPGTTVISGTSSPYTLDRTYSDPIGSTSMSYVSSGSDPSAVQTYIDSSGDTATFTGSISGTTLTASGVTGFITLGSGSGGDALMGSGVPDFLWISSQLTGTQGKDGTYALTSNAGTISSRSMTTQGRFSVPQESLYLTRIGQWGAGFTNKDGIALSNMIGYEGSYSPDYLSGSLSSVDQLYARGKVVTSTPNMPTGIEGYTLLNCNNFKAAGGKNCSQFNVTGISPSINAWSAIDDLFQPPPTPIWDGYKAYQNFILKRDLDPASNDNSPMWLEKVA